MHIADSVYFISGGASGLGEAAARRLAANGAAGVVISDLNLEAAQKLASELGEVALAVRVDVQNTDEIAAGMDAAISRFGRIDAAINCVQCGPAGDVIAAGSSDGRIHFICAQTGEKIVCPLSVGGEV